jgi:hypothetical protein
VDGVPNLPPMLVMICGPYTSGTGGNPDRIAANRERLESFALPIYEKGHLPLIGEWVALPIIRAAGGRNVSDDVFRQYQYPVAHRLLERCDAVLRIPGESKGPISTWRAHESLACESLPMLPRYPMPGARASDRQYRQSGRADPSR